VPDRSHRPARPTSRRIRAAQRGRPRLGGRLPSASSVGLVAAGGALGALARVALATWRPAADDAVPWTTLLENLAGAFLLGLVLTVLAERVVSDRWVRLFVCTGTLGAFTTYSTFATELGGRLLDGHVLVAVVYAAASLVGGLALGLAGIRAARAWPWVPTRARASSRRRDTR
jgi:fluoride exporter